MFQHVDIASNMPGTKSALIDFMQIHPMHLALALALPLFLVACGGDPDTEPPPDEVSCGDTGCLGGPWTSSGGFGEICSAEADCHSGMCGQDSVTGQMFCTQICDTSNPCPRSAGCFPTGNGQQQVCGPPLDG
jgi:hypothetical protein